jgi:hypothetical protein
MKHRPLSRISPLASWASVGVLSCAMLALTACPEREPPAQAQIECENDNECPEGWACKGETADEQRCVKTSGEGTDDQPPELADGTIIDPLLGKDGTVFTVCFSAKEELDQDPIVQVDTGAGLANLTLLEELPALCNGSTWAYTYTADITKDAAGNRALKLNLVDTSLNRADGLALG